MSAQNDQILISFCQFCRRTIFVHRHDGFARFYKNTTPVQKVQKRRACAQKMAPVSAKVCVSFEF